MGILDKLERALGRFAISNLSLYLIIGQVFFVLAVMFRVLDPERVDYAAMDLLRGEWWRAITFMFISPLPGQDWGYIFLVIRWYLFYLMGNGLEGYWGAFRYNVFLFVSYALTIAFSFLTPRYAISNQFILGSVFIAFAYLNPDFELLLIILPVKIKWLALVSVIFGAYNFIVGGLAIRLQIAAAVVSFVLFFGADIIRTLKHGQRTRARRAEREAEAEQPRHMCIVCGKTDKTHPDLDFRYCSKCAGDQCYCPEHMQNHTHVIAGDEKSSG